VHWNVTGEAEGGREPVGYLDRPSVAPGEPLVVHVAAREIRRCWVDIYEIVGCDPRYRPRLRFVHRSAAVEPLRYARETPIPLGPGDADTEGCRWPGTTAVEAVPDSWPSGLYLAQFTTAAAPTGQLTASPGANAVFVVRAGPHAASDTLVQLGVATWSAYHIWRDRNLYIADVGDPTGRTDERLRAHRVSLHRPGIGLVPEHRIPWWPPRALLYSAPFIGWLRTTDFSVDFCTGLDLHFGTVDLDEYNLLFTVGHDEYWTGRQRDVVEAFTAAGGNAVFLGGNIAYWQIRVSDDGSAIDCYKRDDRPSRGGGTRPVPLDPAYRDPELYPEHDNDGVTVEFWAPPVDRSTTTLTGVSMRNDALTPGVTADDPEAIFAGATWWWENFGGPARPAVGFTVCAPDHWLLAGTGLRLGDTFGLERKLVGYECDGLDVEWRDGVPTPTGRDGAPSGVEILAYADCRDWAEVDYDEDPPVATPGRRQNAGAMGGVVTLTARRTPAGGWVVSTAVTDWVHALVQTIDYTQRVANPVARPPDAAVRQITHNILQRLRTRETR
jgi:hypothetical protein